MISRLARNAKSQAAHKAGFFSAEIIPISIKQKGKPPDH
jgi:acetyl-CoA acetyltransferase